MDFTGKKAVILGFGEEGRSSAEFLLSEGAMVRILERKPQDEFSRETIAALKEKGAVFSFESDELGDADILVRSPGVPLFSPPVEEARARKVPITSPTAIFLERSPGVVIGVTGTKGKGTTSCLIYEMLKAAGKEAVLVGNIGVPALPKLKEITPETFVVYEMSSFQLLEITKSPHVAVVLMVTQDHLDFHGTLDEYGRAKRNIVAFQTADDFVVANADYPISKGIAQSSRAKKFLVSRRQVVPEGCFVEKGNIMVRMNGTLREIAPVSVVAIAGAHNLENICAATMVAAVLGLPEEAMRKGYADFKGLPHRLQFVGEHGGVKYFDDSISTTPESALAASEAFAEPKVLILGGSPKGADFSALAKSLAASDSIRAIVGIGKEWLKIKEALQKYAAKFQIIENIADMSSAVRAAKDAAKEGDVVILSPGCASFDMFKDYKDRGDQFKKAVRELK